MLALHSAARMSDMRFFTLCRNSSLLQASPNGVKGTNRAKKESD